MLIRLDMGKLFGDPPGLNRLSWDYLICWTAFGGLASFLIHSQPLFTFWGNNHVMLANPTKCSTYELLLLFKID